VVFADAHPDETTADELHAGFALPANIGANWAVALSRLQGAQPAVIDYLEGTVPGDDQSLGRTPDGDPASAVLLPAPTPGASNLALAPFAITEIRVTPDGGTTFAWQAVPGRRYRVEFKYRLDEPAWRTLSELTANSGAASYTEALPPGVGQRYYRVSAGP
jgi:hypothetical protein